MKKATSREEFLQLLRDRVSCKKLNAVEDAYTLAKYGHRNQLRDQGERYFEHPKSVALILINELDIYDHEMIIMALLHDIIEDTFILSRDGLERLFGARVTEGLEVLTKSGTKTEYLASLNQCSDMDVLIVKFADRLHNLRTLAGVREEKRIKKLKETKELYLPLLESALETANRKQRQSLQYLESKIRDIV